MTLVRTVASDVEPDGLAELIDDCRQLPAIVLPRPRRVRATAPTGRREIRIPEATAAYLDGYDEYGS